MNRQEKKSVIDSIKHDFEHSQASFIISMQGMSVETVQKLRRELYAKKGKIKVAKNTLLKRATSDMPGLTDLSPYFKDQIAIVFAESEAPAIAKVLSNAAKEIESLKLRAGSLDARFITQQQIEFLAALPSREVLLAQLAGTLNAPIRNYVSLLNQLITRLVVVLKAIEEKKR
jgi:large subunit ribosomal protein L10